MDDRAFLLILKILVPIAAIKRFNLADTDHDVRFRRKTGSSSRPMAKMTRLAGAKRTFKVVRRRSDVAAERTWRERYLRVTGVTPLTFYLEWKVQVAHQGTSQVQGGL